MHLITGKKGEPHITAENHGFINAQILGNGNFVFDFGNNFAAVKLNDNSVEIKDGQGMFGGRHFEIEYGTTENVTIENGTIGLNRKDLIVARYAKDSEGIETLELAVKKGAAVSGNPVDPYYDTRTPYTGADGGEFPLWRVNIVDTTITSLEPVYDIVDFDFAQLQLDIQTALGEFDDAMDTINGKSNKDNTPKVWAGSGDPFTVSDDTDWPESSEIKVGDIYIKTATNEFYFVKLVASGDQGAAKLPQWVKILTAADIENKPTEFKGTSDPFTVPTTTEEEQVKVGDFYVKKSGSLRVGFWICNSVIIESGEITEVEWEEVALSAYYLVRDETIKFFYGESAPTTSTANYPGVVSGDVYIETGTGDYYSNRRVNNIKGLWIAKISNTFNLSWEEVALSKNTIKRTDGIKIFFGTEPTASTTQGAVGGDIFFAGHTGSNRQWVFKNLYVCEEYSGTKTWKKIAVGEFYTKTQTDTLLNAKQDTLTAGNNITIDANNVISATGGSGGTTEKIFDEDSTNPIGNDTLLEVFESGVLDKYEMVSEPVILTPEWELGAFNSVGEKSDSNQRSRITNPIEITNTITIDSLSSVGYAYCVYNENMTFNSQKSHTNNYLTEQTTIEPASDAKYINIWNNSSDQSRANEFIQIGLEIDEPTKMEVTEKVMYTKNEIDAMVLNYWKSKNIAWIGDSIPHGQISGGNVQTPYPNIVSNNLGGVLTNYSIGGTVFASKTNYGGAFSSRADFDNATKDTSLYYDIIEGQSYYSLGWDSERSVWAQVPIGTTRTPLSERIKLMNANMDLVCVHCGTNDFQYNWTDIGTMSDRTNHTFYGALHNCCLQLLEKYLAKQIIFLTPIKRAQTPYTTTESENDYNKTLKDYCEIIKEVCDYYSIPVIDLYSISTLNPQLNIQSSLFDNVKTHPLQTGHNILAGIVTSQIKGFRSY